MDMNCKYINILDEVRLAKSTNCKDPALRPGWLSEPVVRVWVPFKCQYIFSHNCGWVPMMKSLSLYLGRGKNSKLEKFNVFYDWQWTNKHKSVLRNV